MHDQAADRAHRSRAPRAIAVKERQPHHSPAPARSSMHDSRAPGSLCARQYVPPRPPDRVLPCATGVEQAVRHEVAGCEWTYHWRFVDIEGVVPGQCP
jgi:hypothetical protein